MVCTHRIVDFERDTVPGVERAEEGLEIIPVPDQYVGEDSTQRQVGRDQIQRVGGREPGGLIGQR